MRKKTIVYRDEMLPQPSIMAKLKSYDPEAPEKILGMAEESQTHRHKLEDVSKQGLCRIFGDLIKNSGRKTRLQDDSDAIAGDWIRVGNDMRRAIRAYMTDHGLDVDELGLSAAECRSLMEKPVPDGNVRFSNTP